MVRRLAVFVAWSCLFLAPAAAFGWLSLAAVCETPAGWKAGERSLWKDDRRPERVEPRAPALQTDPMTVADMTDLPAAHVVVVIHGVNDDGKGWSLRVKGALTEGRPENRLQEVYLFRWTQPNGARPDLTHARSCLADLEKKYPDSPEFEAGYQVEVARRLRDFLAGARALYAEYGIEGKIDVVAHSQGSLITLKALDLGAEADNVVFLGSPLRYTGGRQDDVAAAVPHVRGVLYNYYTKSDAAIRVMGGGWLVEPKGWPELDLPRETVVQTCLDVQGHTGYYTEEAIRANYRDKLGVRQGAAGRLPPERVKEFAGKWRALVESARLIDPE